MGCVDAVGQVVAAVAAAAARGGVHRPVLDAGPGGAAVGELGQASCAGSAGLD